MADLRVLVVENEADDPIGPVGGWLTDAGLSIETVRPYLGDPLPENLDGVDGLIVLGGAMGANDDDIAPWLPATRRLLAESVERQVPALGICLGGQLLAVATGGRVERSPDGPEYGAQLIAKRAGAATDPLFGPIPITPDVLQWHVDAIVELPPSAVQLATSPGCANQAFRIGRLGWGTQFHFETTPEVVRRWAAADADSLEDYDVERILARCDAAHADIAEVWQPVMVAWAAIVADPTSVPAARPLRVSTAEPVTDPAEIRAALAAEMQAARGLPWPVTGRPDQ